MLIFDNKKEGNEYFLKMLFPCSFIQATYVIMSLFMNNQYFYFDTFPKMDSLIEDQIILSELLCMKFCW